LPVGLTLADVQAVYGGIFDDVAVGLLFTLEMGQAECQAAVVIGFQVWTPGTGGGIGRPMKSLRVLIPGIGCGAVSVVGWASFGGAFAEMACLSERDLE